MRIGFIGIGLMGAPMARTLLRAGYEVLVWNRTPQKAEALAADGAAVSSLPEIGRDCPFIVMMLTDAPQTEAVLFGPGGLAEHLHAGQTVIDMSSAAPKASRALAKRLKALGVDFLDAPVSGGVEKAAEGSLSIMAGGAETVFSRCLPLLNAMGASVVRCGGTGAGSMAKLVNQVIVAGNIAALAEGLTLARQAGADPEAVLRAIRGGAAGSVILDSCGLRMLTDDFCPGGTLNTHRKDLDHVLEAGGPAGAPLPLTETIREMMRQLAEEGFGGEDHCALVRWYREAAEGRADRKG